MCTSLTPRALYGCAGLAPATAARWGAERLARGAARQIGNGRSAGRLYSSSKVVDLTTLPQKSSQRIDSVQSVTTADAGGLVGAGAPHLRLDWGEDRPKTILMIKKHKNDETTELLDKMATHVLANYPGTRVLIEPSAGVELPHLPTYHPDDRHALGTVVDLVIAVGGDGTILHVASLFNGEAPPILAFCKGTLGFLTPFRPDEMEGAIERVMKGGFSVTSRMRLSCRLNARDQPYDGKVFQVMNEVAVQGNFVRLTTIDCFVDNHHLGRSTGDGMLAATSTGSTAYSYSCGGSAIHPSLQAIVLTPIATRTLPFRPIILPKGPTLKLRLSEHSRDEANVWVDSQRHYRLARGGSVEISASPYPIVTVNRGEEETHDWLKALKGMNRFVEREYAGPDDDHHHSEAGHHHRRH